MVRHAALSLPVLALPVLPAWSAETPVTASLSPLGGAGGSLVQMVLGLVVVLAFILGAAWLARRFTPLRGGDGAIRLRGGLSLGTRERLVLVEVEGVKLLVGVSPGRLQTLHVFDRAAAPDDFQSQLLRAEQRGRDGQ